MLAKESEICSKEGRQAPEGKTPAQKGERIAACCRVLVLFRKDLWRAASASYCQRLKVKFGVRRRFESPERKRGLGLGLLRELALEERPRKRRRIGKARPHGRFERPYRDAWGEKKEGRAERCGMTGGGADNGRRSSPT